LATYRLVSNNYAAFLMLDDLHRRVMLDSGGGTVGVAEVPFGLTNACPLSECYVYRLRVAVHKGTGAYQLAREFGDVTGSDSLRN
jgi:hypothetical protein